MPHLGVHLLKLMATILMYGPYLISYGPYDMGLHSKNQKGPYGSARTKTRTSATTLRMRTRASKMQDDEDVDVLMNFLFPADL